jgi:adenylate cyclase
MAAGAGGRPRNGKTDGASRYRGQTELPLALTLAAAVQVRLTCDHDMALAAVDRAMTINANTAAALSFAALARCICGMYETAIEDAQRAMRLSPMEPLVYHAALALALASLSTGKNEEAVAHARSAIEGNRNLTLPYCILALACACLDRGEEAAQSLRRLTGVAPDLRLSSLCKIRFADTARLESHLDLLRKLDLPK